MMFNITKINELVILALLEIILNPILLNIK